MEYGMERSGRGLRGLVSRNLKNEHAMKRWVVFAFGLLTACGAGPQKTTVAAADTATVSPHGAGAPVADKPGLAPVRRVQLPINITDQAQAVAWYAENYWNLFPFADTAYLNSGQLEQAFADWLGVLYNAPSPVRQKAFSTAYAKADAASVDMRDEFMRLSERYLYDPNSPMCSEDLYVDALRAALALPTLDEVEKIRPQAQLTLAMKNRVGDKAADIPYTTVDGKRGSLAALKGKRVVLFFNNPGCTMCKQMREVMVGSPVLNGWLGSGKLVVLAVYPDAEVDKWKEYAPHIPAEWINARADERIKADEVYDLRAIPTFYLIDPTGKVELKDVTVEALLGYLAERNP